jgi:hypothetical protein
MARIPTTVVFCHDDYVQRMNDTIKKTASTVEPEQDEEEVVVTKNVVSIQDRINNKASELIGDLEQQIDILIKQVKTRLISVVGCVPTISSLRSASKIAACYRPLYIELYDAYEGKNKDPERNLQSPQENSVEELS